MTLYARREMPPEPWTHEDNPEWIFVESHPEPYMLVPVEHEGIITLDGYRFSLESEFDYGRKGSFMLVRVEDTELDTDAMKVNPSGHSVSNNQASQGDTDGL